VSAFQLLPYSAAARPRAISAVPAISFCSTRRYSHSINGARTCETLRTKMPSHVTALLISFETSQSFAAIVSAPIGSV
jgi:hypothetical protein